MTQLFGSIKRTLKRFRPDPDRARYADLADYDIDGYDRIYHIHVRKTGGTSLNQMFLRLETEEPDQAYRELGASPPHRIVRGGKIFVGWTPHLINQGHYFYAFSHEPLDALRLPPSTFMMTCLRDPVQRVFSHYSMVRSYVEDDIAHPCVDSEGSWLGSSFNDFLDNVPRRHLHNQLYMFSEDFDEERAFERIVRCEHVMFTERFSQGVEELNRKTGLRLKTLHRKKSSGRYDLTDSARKRAREMLEPEYRLLRRVEQVVESRTK